MSLSEIIDNGVPIPWANFRMNNLTCDGNLLINGSETIVGPVTYSGPVIFNSSVTANSNLISNAEVDCSVIKPAIPNGNIVVVANGVGNVLDSQLAITRVLELEVNELAVNSSASIQLDNDLIPISDNSINLGSSSVGFGNIYGDNLAASTVNSNLNISANGTGIIQLNNDMQCTGNIISFGTGSIGGDLTGHGNCEVVGSLTVDTGNISSLNNNNIHLQPNGTGIVLMQNSGQTYGDFTVNQILNLNGNVVPVNDNSIAIGNSSFAVANEYLYNLFLKSSLTVTKAPLVTQVGTLTSAVTSNGGSGIVVTVSSTLAANTQASFAINNSNFTTANQVLLQLVSYTGTTGNVTLMGQMAGAGVIGITILNSDSALAQNGVITFSYLII